MWNSFEKIRRNINRLRGEIKGAYGAQGRK